MLGAVFERFVDKSPLSVMVRATLERVLSADRLDLWYERTAEKQYTRALLFSTVYDLMSQVVLCVQPSVRAAYLAREADVGTSIVSVYNKLNGLETRTSAELVRYSAREFAPLIAQMDGERAPWLQGYRVKIVDGNCLAASEQRLTALREAPGRGLPGKSLVVYEPAPGLVTDVFPCEDGHAQERSLLGAVLATVAADDLWIADRNFCTRTFLCDMDTRGGFFVIRQHQGLSFEVLNPLGADARIPTGHIAQQRVCVVDEHGTKHVWRRLRLKLAHATRNGATLLHILTNLPRQLPAQRVAQLYRNRWTLETAFQHLEASLHSEINTLGYPKAALFGFSLALVAYNVLAVVLAALRSVHSEETVEHEVSLYYIANELATTYTGMMIAIPEPEWAIFYAMRTADLAAILRELAQRVRVQALRKSRQNPRQSRGKRPDTPKKGHVSTAKLLRNRKAQLAAP
jgi:IS4 transposase